MADTTDQGYDKSIGTNERSAVAATKIWAIVLALVGLVGVIMIVRMHAVAALHVFTHFSHIFDHCVKLEIHSNHQLKSTGTNFGVIVFGVKRPNGLLRQRLHRRNPGVERVGQ